MFSTTNVAYFLSRNSYLIKIINILFFYVVYILDFVNLVFLLYGFQSLRIPLKYSRVASFTNSKLT